MFVVLVLALQSTLRLQRDFAPTGTRCAPELTVCPRQKTGVLGVFYTANLNESENHLEHVMQFEEYSSKVALDLVTGRTDGRRTDGRTEKN